MFVSNVKKLEVFIFFHFHGYFNILLSILNVDSQFHTSCWFKSSFRLTFFSHGLYNFFWLSRAYYFHSFLLHLQNASKKAIAKIPMRIIKSGDKVIIFFNFFVTKIMSCHAYIQYRF